MKKAAMYLRMSTDKQEYSIKSQQNAIKKYAKDNGYKVLEIFKDEGISGRDAKKRPSFMEMIEKSRYGSFKYVLIYDSSRFARNLEQSLIYKSILKKNGVKLISITEPSLDEDSELLTDALLGAMNEMYSIKLSKVVKRGMANKASNGEYISSAPYGYYKPKGKTLIIVEKEADIIREIFLEYIKGKSTYYIAKTLNKKGIMTKKGNKIDTRFIKRVLNNNTYKGYYKFCVNGETMINKSEHMPIIDEETFAKAHNIMLENEKRKRYKAKPIEYNKHWLVGLIRCIHCGSTFVYAKYYNNRQDRYRCGGYTSGKCECSFSIGVYDIEDIVIKNIKNIYKQKEYTIKKYKLEKDDKKRYISQIKKYEKAIEKAKKAYLMDIDTIEEYKNNKEKITKNIDGLKKCIENIDTDIEDIKKVCMVSILKGEGNKIFKNKIAKSIIDKILIDGKKAEIEIYFLL